MCLFAKEERQSVKRSRDFCKKIAASQKTCRDVAFVYSIDICTANIYLRHNRTVPLCHDEGFIELAERKARLQNDGVFEAHMEAAHNVCKKYDVPICDCYAIWKKLSESGVDTTELLANKINHPTREMNWLFAAELVRTMFFK